MNSERDMHKTTETPLSVGMGLLVHQKTRSKELADLLSNMNLSVSYGKVLTLKRSIANTVKSLAASNEGIYVPSVISPNKPVYFAIDNSEL